MKHSTLGFLVAVLSVALAGCGTTAPRRAPAPSTPSSAPATPAAPAAEAAVAPQAAQQEGAPVAIFLAQKKQAPGTTALKLPDTTLWYPPQPVLTRADIARATPLQTKEGRSAILFNFSAEGAKKLAGATGAGDKGRYLVVVVGNEVVAAPQIDAQLTAGALGFAVSSPAQSQAIMDALRGPDQQ